MTTEMGRRNIIAALFLILLSIGYGFLASGLPERPLPNTPGPSFFPWLITIGLFLLSVALLIQGFLPRPVLRGAPPAAAEARKRWIMVAVFGVYVFALPPVGFIGATVPFFAVMSVLYGERRPVWAAAGAIVIPVLLYLLVRDVFSILLPRGPLEALLP